MLIPYCCSRTSSLRLYRLTMQGSGHQDAFRLVEKAFCFACVMVGSASSASGYSKTKDLLKDKMGLYTRVPKPGARRPKSVFGRSEEDAEQNP